MLTRLLCTLSLAGALTCVVAPPSANGQTPPYRDRMLRGQDVAPAFEGWRRNADETYTMYFGYMNRNHEEEVDIPVGPDNNVDPGGDRGQPTHFYTRRNAFLFIVTVPKDWGMERKVVWTLTTRGKTNKAYGWLQPEWEINDEIVMMNSGGGADLQNTAPKITGTGPLTVGRTNSATLTATAQDDGRPRPRRVVVDPEAVGTAAQQGLTVRWIHYRGPGKVTFGQGSMANGYEKPVTAATTARFSAPGVYVLRAVATDGSLEAFHDVTVTVN